MKRKSSNQKMFTLIELLLVVAIIMILVSMMLPALSKMRKTGIRLLCMNQQKQAVLGIINWMNDNKGYYQITSGSTHIRYNLSSAGYVKTKNLICPGIEPFINGDTAYNELLKDPGKYPRNFYAVKSAYNKDKAPEKGFLERYGEIRFTIGSNQYYYFRKMKEPSRNIILTDALAGSGCFPEFNFAYAWYIHPRHLRTAVLSFADGHAENAGAAKLVSSFSCQKQVMNLQAD